jgi:uncharacterized protein
MSRVELSLLHCYRCGHRWAPQKPEVRICPHCKSPLWDEPKIRVPHGGGGLGIEQVLGPHRREILRIARRYGAQELRVFGSVARGSATEDSDVDFLVTEFSKDRPVRAPLPALRMGAELSELLGRDVDVVTEQGLFWLVQPQVITEAVPL